jgi:predicted nucleic acid-binding protein
VETIVTALTAQHDLAAQSEHRVPIADRLIAACARQHQPAVLHVDRRYETLAAFWSSLPHGWKPEPDDMACEVGVSRRR